MSDSPREMSGWRTAVSIGLGVTAVLLLLRSLASLAVYSVGADAPDVISAYHGYAVWTSIGGLVYFAAGIIFIVWFYRAYANLRRLGLQDLRYGNAQATWSWFVPFFSWVRPKQIANDIWRGSEPGVQDWRAVRVPALVHWWWGLFIAQGLVFALGEFVASSAYDDIVNYGFSDDRLASLRGGALIGVGGSLLSVAAAILAILVVTQISGRLDEARAAVLASPPSPQPWPTRSEPAPGDRVACPECAEWIQSQANVCRFCGHPLRPLEP